MRGATEEPPRGTYYCLNNPKECREGVKREWQATQEAAHKANEPCQFTAFAGYEWTASPRATHTHRNVIFRNDKVPDDAYDFIRFPTSEMLWRACLLYTSPSPRDATLSRMPSSA